jgi:hypothetical protein
MTAIIAIEGVLKKETGDPIPEGIKLFRVLTESYRVVLSSDMDADATKHWLRGNMVFGYADVYDNSMFFEGQELRLRHLDLAKSKGKVELFIDSDSDHCAAALAAGVPTIMFASPIFVRTLRSVRGWDELQEEVDRQKNALLDAHLGSRIKRFE